MSEAALEAIAQLQAARERSRQVAADLRGERELGPQISIVNPPRWELGHLAWFQEFWCLRGAGMEGGSILPNGDALYNSAAVPHRSRWTLELPDFDATLRYGDEVLDRVSKRLCHDPSDDALYFARLAARHEEMHAEAFHYTRQTLGYAAPALQATPSFPGKAASGDVDIPGGAFNLGASRRAGFAFDNEKWEHPVILAPFRMSRVAVTNGEFAYFVERGGYRQREFWSDAGWSWLRQAARDEPRYWKAGMERRFDRWHPRLQDSPVMNVCWHEAQAYCRFAGRRLPTEAEWEFAACFDPRSGAKRRYPWGDEPWSPALANLQGAEPASVNDHPAGDSALGLRQMLGNVWEWTESSFLPYPGFVRDPYKEYSEPWFGTHKVLRGGSFATPFRVVHGMFRNFYTPDRADIFAGFRTCAA